MANKYKNPGINHPVPLPQDEIMVFPEDMFYDNPTIPLYLKGKEYLVKGPMVERWIMHGGVIVNQGNPSVQQVPIDPELAAQLEKEKAEADAERAAEAKAKAKQAKDEEDAAAKKEADDKSALEKIAADEKAKEEADKKKKSGKE